MVPSAGMAARSTGMWQRNENGELVQVTYPLQAPLTASAAGGFFHSGGAGLFGSVREFSKILRVLLNDGVVAETGQRILSADSISDMFANKLPDQPNFARQALPAVKPELVYETPELYPLCPADKPQGWGLGFMISPGITGRSDATGHWSGLSNAAELWVRVEQALYAALENVQIPTS
ncbi:hypothetical protein SCUCBS95973_004100 [Sporothrix curviconia]|uniref:Beta-lactamase-related domain-containing protein n=1 Tax=Sporothrix curviconia TaxID=1260050 RepID=A0ABP0BKY1_9PEZI